MIGRRRLSGAAAPGLVAIALLVAGCCHTSAARVAYAFTVVAPSTVGKDKQLHNHLVARVIIKTPNASCPEVQAVMAGQKEMKIAMQRLHAPAGSVGFDGITVCLVNLRLGLKEASVGGKRLPLLPANTPQRIAVFGDTGCRVKGTKIQICSYTPAWPLATVAEGIAKAKPDLILNTGDFFYREADCPKQDTRCAGSPPINPAGSPNEDNWAVWEADWFHAAQPIFSVAPLMLARGNHEICARAGTGYFFLLDPDPSLVDSCQHHAVGTSSSANIAEPTWMARFGSIEIVNLDSSHACDATIEATPGRNDPCGGEGSIPYTVYVKLGRRAVALVKPGKQNVRVSTRWLLTHRPVYAWERFDGPDKPPVWATKTLEAALDPRIKKFDAIISGDLHLFQTVQLPGRPAQLTLGDGGTALDPEVQGGKPPTKGPAPDFLKLGESTTSFTFGWMLLPPDGTKDGVFDWRALSDRSRTLGHVYPRQADDRVREAAAAAALRESVTCVASPSSWLCSSG